MYERTIHSKNSSTPRQQEQQQQEQQQAATSHSRRMSTKQDQEEEASTPLSWKDAGELKDWFVSELEMDDDQEVKEAADVIFKKGGKKIDRLRNIKASYLTSIGVDGFVAQELENKLKDAQVNDVPSHRGVLPRIESDAVYKVTDERIRAKFTNSNVSGVHRYVMEAELMVDSGANTELKLSARKVRELGLEIRSTQRCRGSTNDVCQVYVFSPVLVQATFTRESVQETIQADLVVKCYKREYDALSNAQPGPLVFETPDCPIAGATPNNNDGTSQITVIRVSPTKHRPNDAPLQQAVIGIDGMKKLRLHLNGERQRLEIEEEEVLDEH